MGSNQERWRHSENQMAVKRERDRRPKDFSFMDKQVKAVRRRQRLEDKSQDSSGIKSDGSWGQDEYQTVTRPARVPKSEELFRIRTRFQVGRAFGHMLRGTATPQEMDFIDRLGDVVYDYITEKGNRATIIS